METRHNTVSLAMRSPVNPDFGRIIQVRYSRDGSLTLARRSTIGQTWSRESMMVFADSNGVDWRLEEGAEEREGGDELRETRTENSESFVEADMTDMEATVSKPETPYHIMSLSQKKRIVYIVSLGGLFSPLSSNIYFPALAQISQAIRASISLVSLTITVYMIVQGLAPSFWGPLSDTKGRRVAYISTFLIYILANVSLAFSNNFISLMVFRGLQAAGSAATISIGAGVIGDITTAKERGGLIGIFGGIRMLGQSMGPVFGGIISQFLGFHAIFWFLTGLSVAALLLIVLLLPETLRSIAGNGSIPLAGFYRPLIYTPPDSELQSPEKPKRASLTFSAVLSPLRFLFEKDVFATLFLGSIVYTVWSMVTSSTTDLFKQNYGLNTLQVGLAFLPNGIGCVAGSYLTGILMDVDFKLTETEYKLKKGLQEDAQLTRKELAATDFPIERARQRSIWEIVSIFIISTAAYGFSVTSSTIALPLVLQFAIAGTATAVFSLNSALVIDLYPGASASATAVNNLVRCSVGALGVALIQPLLAAVGPANTFVMLAGLTLLSSPLLLLVNIHGMSWRLERAERLRKAKVDQEKGEQGE